MIIFSIADCLSEFLPPDFERYTAESRRIMEIFRSYTPLVEPLSLDEAFMDLGGTAKLHGAPPAVMLARLTKRMKDELGVTGAGTLADVVAELEPPRSIWIMVPAAFVGATVDALAPLLDALSIDAGQTVTTGHLVGPVIATIRIRSGAGFDAVGGAAVCIAGGLAAAGDDARNVCTVAERIMIGRQGVAAGGEVVGKIPEGLPSFEAPSIQWDLVLALLPATLAGVWFFGLGVAAGLLRSELRLPPAIYDLLSTLLLLTIGLKGGVELARAPLAGIVPQAAGVKVLGATSGYLVADVSDATSPVCVGDELAFSLNYAALLAAMTSEYVHKHRVGGGGDA